MSDSSVKIDFLKNLYGEICLGFSEFNYSGKPIFIKHFTEIENGILSKNKEIYLKEALNKGLEQKEDKILFLLKEKIWDREKEVEIERLKKEISDLDLILKNLIIKRQINETKKKIQIAENKLLEIEKEKNTLIGFTAEEYVEKNYNELFISQAFYKDQDLKQKFFSIDEFNALEDEELVKLIHQLNSFYRKFSIAEIKRISACPFLMNLFYLCNDNAFYFYGKYIKDLTIFQSNLFSQCKYFKSLMQNKAQSSPPEDVAEDPDKMIEWYEMVASEKDVDQNEQSLGVGHVGASHEELQKMAGGTAVAISDIAKQKGNKLTKEDFLKMHGI